MSPASAGSLQIEQYIGACLITQNRPKNIKNREFYPHNNTVYHQNHPGYGNYQHEGWAGGVPLISFANHQRRANNVVNRRHNEFEEANANLAKLAVHTQGAPLIVTKSYQHRKNKPQRNDGLQQTKIFENSSHKKHEMADNNNKNVDTISVTSDESSGSQNSEMCLPRIIKPRKRRKKDRKPAHLRAQNHTNFDYNAPTDSPPNMSPYIPNNTFDYSKVSEKVNPIFDIFGEISETPKLHHDFDDIKEDLNGNQTAINCQCRYCDLTGHNIWDFDRNCYSPFLTTPKSFDFLNLDSVLSNISSGIDEHYLEHGLSLISLEDSPKRRSSFSRSCSSSSASSSFSSSDLEVSTEIVTSLNGHRDLEIKFFNPSNTSGHKDKEFGALKREINARCEQDGLSEQNTSFFSNGTITF